MNTAKVSVIIPAFNAAKTLAEAVASAVNGSYQYLEILIVDDCSTDDTSKVAAKLAESDPRIQLFINPQNYGVSKSRNLMIDRATGEYVAFLDSDDTWEPNKLEFCLQMLAENPEVKAVAHALRYLDKSGNKLSYIATYPTTKAQMQAIKVTGESPWVFPSSVVVDRAILVKEGGFAEDWLVGEDTELFTKIAQKHGLLAATQPLGNYRIRENSLTDKHWLKKRIAADCVKENQRRRLQGEPELSLNEYEHLCFQDLPLWKRLNKFRKFLALHYMRKVGQSWLNREFLPTLVYGIVTTVLNPQASLNKLKWMKYHEERFDTL
ncbi:MAG: glycosyltransferase family A protein [Tychonema bourrellyi B0820]|uniref:Glycosyltransferase family 2 protein n=1 Tax=Tychonema bourrellyi FEM_GT703 TaxID=2040638 RepID=A0A2G4F268_9CYAN|nr:glycosyltransferase family A protein [Tychonema bourrellyi]MDQ2097672.1 glycosyltransferase family A protein [Tychonema bourrellyi B0820]PHX55835.1 glycosyltransferase family 2 protein [Tychonema bourrellyi FEM_GT703]